MTIPGLDDWLQNGHRCPHGVAQHEHCETCEGPDYSEDELDDLADEVREDDARDEEEDADVPF